MKTLIASLFCFSLFFIIGSCNQSNQNENWSNLKKVHTGMKYLEVETVMGKPDKIENETSRIRLTYKAPIGMSDDFYIFLSKEDSMVVGITDGL